MTLKEIFSNLEEANFDLLIQVLFGIHKTFHYILKKLNFDFSWCLKSKCYYLEGSKEHIHILHWHS